MFYRAILLGDAAHAMFNTLGQGVNSAFEVTGSLNPSMLGLFWDRAVGREKYLQQNCNKGQHIIGISPDLQDCLPLKCNLQSQKLLNTQDIQENHSLQPGQNLVFVLQDCLLLERCLQKCKGVHTDVVLCNALEELSASRKYETDIAAELSRVALPRQPLESLRYFLTYKTLLLASSIIPAAQPWQV